MLVVAERYDHMGDNRFPQVLQAIQPSLHRSG